MGDFALSAIVSIGNLCAFVIGKALGRTLQLNRDKVQKIGQVVFASLIIGTGIGFTFCTHSPNMTSALSRDPMSNTAVKEQPPVARQPLT